MNKPKSFSASAIPILENGDLLSRSEFERRYQAMPWLKKEDGYIEGAPELVVEIAASTASIDLRDKKRAYRRNGVREYLVWQVMTGRLDWFYLQSGLSIAVLFESCQVISRLRQKARGKSRQ